MAALLEMGHVCSFVYRMSNLKEAICSLMQVARVLKKRRFEGGALELEGVEVKLTLQRTGDDITVEEILPKQVWCLYCGARLWCGACLVPLPGCYLPSASGDP